MSNKYNKRLTSPSPNTNTTPAQERKISTYRFNYLQDFSKKYYVFNVIYPLFA